MTWKRKIGGLNLVGKVGAKKREVEEGKGLEDKEGGEKQEEG